MKVSFVSSQAISQAMRFRILGMQADLATANKEAVTQTVADRGLALGAQTGMSVSWHRNMDRLKGLTDSNEVAASRLASSQLIMEKLTDEANALLSTYTTALSGTAASNIAREEAKAFLSSMTGQLNKNLNGENLFSGINTDVQPLDDFSDPDSTSRKQFDRLFSDHFGFSTSDAAVTGIDPADMEDFFTTVLEPYFMDTGWTDHWSSATDNQIVSRITLNEIVDTSVSANNEPFRRLALASAAASALMGKGMPPETENMLLKKSISTLGNAISGLADQQGSVGIAEQRIKRANEHISMQLNIINKDLVDLEGVDENEAALKVNSLLAQIEISYALTARMQQLSLVKYL